MGSRAGSDTGVAVAIGNSGDGVGVCVTARGGAVSPGGGDRVSGGRGIGDAGREAIDPDGRGSAGAAADFNDSVSSPSEASAVEMKRMTTFHSAGTAGGAASAGGAGAAGAAGFSSLRDDMLMLRRMSLSNASLLLNFDSEVQ